MKFIDSKPGLYQKAFSALARFLPDSFIALLARLALFGVFWQAARTKVEGLLTITDSTFQLFATEYKLPLVPPEIAAYIATYAEHTFSILLLFGLFTRLAALGVFGMTLVIEIFVYPWAWPTHFSWMALALFLVSRGGGVISLDAMFSERRSYRD